MEEGEDKKGNSNKSCSDSTTEGDADADLKRQIDDLKCDVESLQKKLRKAEFERDNALKNVENLKSEVKDLSRRLQEEKKKNAGIKRRNEAERMQGLLFSEIHCTIFQQRLCTSQIEVSTSPLPPPPGQPQAFKFLENFCSNAPLPGPKSCSNASS